MSEDYSCRPIELWAISAKCGIAQDDQVLGDYATKEAAFEAVLGPASNAIKLGQPVDHFG